MQTRSTDPAVSFTFDRRIPVWGIFGVIGSISAAAIAGYIQIDRLSERTASLTEQVKSLNESNSSKTSGDIERTFKILRLEEKVETMQQRLIAVEKR